MDYPQRRIKRSTKFFVVPVVALCFVLFLLIWEIVRENLSFQMLRSLPFAPSTVGIAPAATLAGVLVALLLARSQYAVVNLPYLTGHGTGWDARDKSSQWEMTIHNVGAGLARVSNVEYLVMVVGSADPREYVDVHGARKRLTSVGLTHGKDFAIHELSPGSPLKPSTERQNGFPMFELSRKAAGKIEAFEVRIAFTDLLGDQYEWRKEFGVLLKA